MKYKVGDKAVLRDDHCKFKVVEVDSDASAYLLDVFGWVNEEDIDHEKTAELKQDDSLEKVVAEKNNREINNVDINLGKVHGNDAIKPKHYQKNGIDRIELWKLQYSDQSFRDGMRMLADRYFSRYENKNGIEDLFKGIEVIERLIEWEESLNE